MYAIINDHFATLNGIVLRAGRAGRINRSFSGRSEKLILRLPRRTRDNSQNCNFAERYSMELRLNLTIMRSLIPMLLLPVLAYASDQSGSNAVATISVMPLPASVQTRPGKLKLDGSFAVAISGDGDARLLSAILRLQSRIEGRTGLVLPHGIAPAGAKVAMTVSVTTSGGQYPKFGEDESYALDIGADRASLSATTVWGAMHGMETLLQLVSGDRDGYYLPLVAIQDRPRFPWRGLMIDVGRHFEPVEVIERNVDGLAAVKMNVFH
jgi:hexosaminidase